MTVKELRIGNYVLTKSTCIEIMPLDLVGIYQCEQAKAKIDYWGIDLNEEWLLKFGFEEKIDVFEWEGMTVKINRRFAKGFMRLFEIGGTPNQWQLNYNDERYFVLVINKVHQLQNLYFALTGKELETVESVCNDTKK